MPSRSDCGEEQWQGSGGAFDFILLMYQPKLTTGFELYAAEAGIREGEEVTICYMPESPDEFYYKAFGFLPDDSPDASIVLFSTTAELNEGLASIGVSALLTESQRNSVIANATGLEPEAEKLVMQVLECCLEGSQELMPQGAAVSKLARPIWVKKLWELLHNRCCDMLDDAEELAGRDPPPAKMSRNMKLSVKLRERQTDVLHKLILVCHERLKALAQV